uniref:Peptidase S1 domain-containing protein n=1 Tax=Sinocyclocheilus grahami TaxID=75366 RepID=A0A672K629_SINGR
MFNWYVPNKLTNSTISLSARVNVGIVNGTEVKPHSRPYMVSIKKGKTHVCGGFLISDEFVMTAAHCWNGYCSVLKISYTMSGRHNW